MPFLVIVLLFLPQDNCVAGQESKGGTQRSSPHPKATYWKVKNPFETPSPLNQPVSITRWGQRSFVWALPGDLLPETSSLAEQGFRLTVLSQDGVGLQVAD